MPEGRKKKHLFKLGQNSGPQDGIGNDKNFCCVQIRIAPPSLNLVPFSFPSAADMECSLKAQLHRMIMPPENRVPAWDLILTTGTMQTVWLGTNNSKNEKNGAQIEEKKNIN
jgi:hypothetical protein